MRDRIPVAEHQDSSSASDANENARAPRFLDQRLKSLLGVPAADAS
jgi:hypothetical protein